MNETPIHVHIGSGRLGLGLIGDVATDCNTPVVMFNREGSDPRHLKLGKSKLYMVQSRTGEKLVKLHEYFLYSSDLGRNGPTSLGEWISNPLVRLLTTATGIENFETMKDTARAVWSGLSNRINRGVVEPLFIVAAENMPGNSIGLYDAVLDLACANYGYNKERLDKELKRSHAHFLPCVVDRICTTIDASSDPVRVMVGEYKQWAINVSSIPKEDRYAIEFLRKSEAVRLVDEQRIFELYEKRKAWCLNGIHIASATFAYAHDPPIERLSEALKDQGILKSVRDVQKEFGLALYFTAHDANDPEFSLDNIIKFNDSVLERFQSAVDDPAWRILRNLVHENAPKNITEAMRGTRKKLTDLKAIQDPAVLMGAQNTLIFELVGKTVQETELGEFFRKIKWRILEPIEQLFPYDQKHEASIRLLVRLLQVIDYQLDVFYSNLVNLKISSE